MPETTTTTLDLGQAQADLLRQLQTSYLGIADVGLSANPPIIGLAFTTGAGNVPDSIRGYAAAGVRGLRTVRPRALDGFALVQVSANGDTGTFTIDDLQNDDNLGGGAN